MEYTGNFIGNELAVQYVQQLLQQHRLPATQLWYGPDHSGKTTLAYNLTFWLLCEQRDAITLAPCLRCQSCILLLHDHHPNVFQYPLVGAASIHKASVAEGIQQWQRKPLLNTNRIVIITAAETLTEEAANALLKVLEEPHPQIYFILCTSHLERIFPTIISRCAQLSFIAKTDQLVIDDVALQQWLGILEQPSFSQRLQAVEQAWPKLNDRQHWQQQLVVLAVISRTILLLQHSVTTGPVQQAALNHLAQQYSVAQSLDALRAIAQATRALLHQAQPKLIIEQILLSVYYPL